MEQRRVMVASLLSLGLGLGIGFAIGRSAGPSAPTSGAEPIVSNSVPGFPPEWVAVIGPRGLALANASGKVYLVRRDALVGMSPNDEMATQSELRTEIDPATGAMVLIEENVPTVSATDIIETVAPADIRLGLPPDVSMVSYCSSVRAEITVKNDGTSDCFGELDTTSYPSLETSG